MIPCTTVPFVQGTRLQLHNTLVDAERRLIPADQPLLLPLTGSLYVKGKVANTEQLLVNIGTDYYVEVGRAVQAAHAQAVGRNQCVGLSQCVAVHVCCPHVWRLQRRAFQLPAANTQPLYVLRADDD